MTCQRINETIHSISHYTKVGMHGLAYLPKRGLNALALFPITRLFLACIALGLNNNLAGIALIGGFFGGDRVVTFLDANLLQDSDKHFVRIAFIISPLAFIAPHFAAMTTCILYSLWVGAKFKVYLNHLNQTTVVS